MDKKKIVVMIPAYCEAKTIGDVIGNLHDAMRNYSYEIIVIDDGSTDNTNEVARVCGAIVITHPHNMGLAEAFKTGCKEALKSGADIIINIDGDGQYDANDIAKILRPVLEGTADLVLGWRKHKEKMPLTKKAGNWLLSKAASYIARQKINDAATGFRCFTSEVAKLEIISDFTYTAEQVIRAMRSKKIKILEVPVHFYARKSGESRLFKSSFGYALKMGINILRMLRDFSPIRFFGYIGLFVMTTGLLNGFILQNDISGAILFLAGLNVLVFSFLADMQRPN